MKGLTILRTADSGIEKSVDGKGGITRGTFSVGGKSYENATLVNGIVYDEEGNLVGPLDP